MFFWSSICLPFQVPIPDTDTVSILRGISDHEAQLSDDYSLKTSPFLNGSRPLPPKRKAEPTPGGWPEWEPRPARASTHRGVDPERPRRGRCARCHPVSSIWQGRDGSPTLGPAPWRWGLAAAANHKPKAATFLPAAEAHVGPKPQSLQGPPGQRAAGAGRRPASPRGQAPEAAGRSGGGQPPEQRCGLGGSQRRRLAAGGAGGGHKRHRGARVGEGSPEGRLPARNPSSPCLRP